MKGTLHTTLEVVDTIQPPQKTGIHEEYKDLRTAHGITWATDAGFFVRIQGV